MLIKKYSNRRLYDTEQKCYITLEELAQRIKDGHQIQVLDNDTQQDITQETLLQIIFQMSSKFFSNECLHQLIRMRQDQLQEFFQIHFQSSLDYFLKLKQQMLDQWKTWQHLWMGGVGLPKEVDEKERMQKTMAEYQAKICALEQEISELKSSQSQKK